MCINDTVTLGDGIVVFFVMKKKSVTTTLLSHPFVKKTSELYFRHKRYAPLLSFTGGFALDAFTLSRIDLLRDNLIMLGYLLLLGFLIVLVNFINDDRISKPQVLKYAEWYPLGIQFLLGGLFSKYVIFYFQSAALSKNWVFILLLIVVLVGNEFIKDKLTNLKFQGLLYFLASFSFFIFAVPVLLKSMNALVFVFSGLLSLVFVGTTIYFIFKNSKSLSIVDFRHTMGLIGGFFLLFNLFYFLNWIPPVPLSLKEGGIYHHVHRQGDRYVLRFEKGAWYQPFKRADNEFHYSTGDTVFCFTSVFAPTRLEKKIVHQWQIRNDKQDKWITSDRLGFRIYGGRDGGYRGYTYKKNIQPGKWRVDVRTEDDLLLGRISFTVIPGQAAPVELKTIFR
ncbi:MAG TPA: DUF2914 domain-containing protein [Caldithrix abyssi]|uniref:DUF2914 domain-containing protein n=1 Tax=Caldithrix abyssi TaxID=187145 RepID=A0A7V4U114_CALAY|nr:DUF2914 domain-containing protein [Caldithrix abyssi]